MAQGAKPGEGGQLPGAESIRIYRAVAFFCTRGGLDFAAAASRYLLH